MRVRGAKLCLGLVVAVAATTCLDDAIPPEDWKNLENANGESYPLGIWFANYAANLAGNALVATLIEEVFGFKTDTESGLGPGTVSGMYAILGCADPNAYDETTRGCGGPNATRYHVHMECWKDGYPLVWQGIQRDYPSIAPKNLGNMGYDGLASSFLPKPVQEAAYTTEGLALQYYKNWNASWYDPSKYFDSMEMINASALLAPCTQTVFQDDPTARRHVQFTGDADGVDFDAATNTYSVKCHGGYYWISPTCRGNTSKCIPWVTGGSGWSIEEMMQKSTIHNIPLALAVARSWREYTGYPFVHPKSYFYWWVPDPTFLELQPISQVWPPYDQRGWSIGDQSSGPSATSIDKLVSRDLSILAPNVESFVSNIIIPMKQMDLILLDQKNTGDSWRNATCRWLRSNEALWRSWIPDESQCFPGFGLYDSLAQDYVGQRVNATNKIVCQACPSGTYSMAMTDSIGDTYVCVPCGVGTSQPSGAATFCHRCKPGEYQDEMGQSACKRCDIGKYQDEFGGTFCTMCPASTTTMGLGSVGENDCGCRQNYINMNLAGGFQCQPCSEGLTCPKLSKLADLQSGASELGAEFTPQIQEGYFSTGEAPTEIYRCSSLVSCPGGMPNSCGGGLIGTPCDQCKEGQTWTGSDCADCEGWRQALWVLAVLCIFAFLTLAYYLTSSKVTAKATVLFATTASFGMLVMSMQNLGLIGMMTVDWPADLTGIFSICQFLLLDIDSYGFVCIAGQVAPIRYLLSALIFPVGVAWLAMCYSISRLLPSRLKWDGSKVTSSMGAFLQVGFSTMSATSLAPMMCYRHPNGLRSILKYPGVICGSDEHTAMLVIGWTLLVVFVLGFVSLCTFAVMKVPSWSATRRDHLVACIRFLVFRFRLDSWWFGVPLLCRGPLLSLPVVLATDYPPVQIITIAVVLAGFMVMQMLSWPWKVPMLNLTDAIISFCITLLVTTSSLHLPVIEGPMVAFAEGISTAMLTGIGIALGLMCLMTSSALIYRSALGGKKELRLFNLGSVPDSARLATKVKELAMQLEKMEHQELFKALDSLAVFDMNKITTCITLLATEVAPPAEDAVTYKFNARINSSSFDPSLKKGKRSKRSTASNVSVEAETELAAGGEELPSNQLVEEEAIVNEPQELKSSWI
ncbi:unnamed protein product [Durusdinium trenchii]|uniref:CUB and EGF-like domain-containing protein 3 n=2 Tax=Durusdinium trenchii TaxID=1381693 RepID=A0ABP0PXK8_9DINO